MTSGPLRANDKLRLLAILSNTGSYSNSLRYPLNDL